MKWKPGERVSRWLGLAALAACALGLRCLRPEDRPMHSDEAVHAVILGEMLETGVYRYNPHDSHGPTLYYLAYPLLRVCGVRSLREMEAWQLRLVSALVGTATVLALVRWAEELGAGAAFVAGGWLAVAAPMVYYQRCFIHEGLFVLLTLLLLRCGWSWSRQRNSVGLGALTGTAAGLLFATKETAPLVFLALGLAAAGLWLTLAPGPPAEGPRRFFSWRSIGGASLAFVLVCTLFYGSFGENPRGLADLVAAQFRFARRAAGEGHEKPWWTYLAWLLQPNFYTIPWSGWTVLGLAVLGAVRCRAQPLVRFLSFFGLALGAAYSLVPYKTPWLEINILAPAALLAGAGAAALLRDAGRYRPGVVLLAALAALGLGRETWQTCFAHPVDARNPLAYSPTVDDVAPLVAYVGKIRGSHPRRPSDVIQVISTDYWPLPWYLRRLGPAGYWNAVPAAVTGDIVIASPDLLPALQSKMGSHWKIAYFGLRPEVLAVVLSKPAPDE